MTKWNLPLDPPPSWLDPTAEITLENDNKPEAWKSLRGTDLSAATVKYYFLALKHLGLTNWHALEVLSNTTSEVGWQAHFRGFNCGGWKIHKSDVEEYKKKGKIHKWWRASGNKSSGDPPTCFYRGFDSIEDFYSEWLLRFVPKPGTVSSKHRYKKTGELFWRNDEAWFNALIEAGYKGENTKKNPTSSIIAHKDIKKNCMEYLVQFALGVKADGKFGPKSQNALKIFQKSNGMLDSGIIGPEVFDKLYP